MKPILKSLLGVLLGSWLAMAAGGCGGKDKDKGGDHVPELKTYAVDSLPAPALEQNDKMLRAHEVSSTYFNRFVHLAEVYHFCVQATDFSAVELELIAQTLEQKSAVAINRGLQVVINQALANLRQFKPETSLFSSRIEFRLVYGDWGDCHLQIVKQSTAGFPWQESEFVQSQFALFYPNQLRVSDGRINQIAVGYVKTGAVLEVERLIAAFVGFGSSSEPHSKLNQQSRSPVGYLPVDDSEQILANDDAVMIYGFAAMFHDILQPKDLGTFHHYADQLAPGELEQDDLLILPEGSVNIPFRIVRGSPYLNGVRQTTSKITVCFLDGGTNFASDSDYEQWLKFLDSESEPYPFGGIGYQLKVRRSDFVLGRGSRSDPCQLIVSLRSAQQFPFNSRPLNGLYVHEGHIKDSSGQSNSIPLIYLNTSNLSKDDSGSQKPIATVLQHEFAHFLGFKHSESSQSILSPAGYNRGWDLNGGDGKAFDTWLKLWTPQSQRRNL